jgi:hypothetical protein
MNAGFLIVSDQVQHRPNEKPVCHYLSMGTPMGCNYGWEPPTKIQKISGSGLMGLQ